MSKIEHVHQTKHQRKARGHDENDHAHGQTRHTQGEPCVKRAHKGQCRECQDWHQQQGLDVQITFEIDRHNDKPNKDCCSEGLALSAAMLPE